MFLHLIQVKASSITIKLIIYHKILQYSCGIMKCFHRIRRVVVLGFNIVLGTLHASYFENTLLKLLYQLYLIVLNTGLVTIYIIACLRQSNLLNSPRKICRIFTTSVVLLMNVTVTKQLLCQKRKISKMFGIMNKYVIVRDRKSHAYKTITFWSVLTILKTGLIINSIVADWSTGTGQWVSVVISTKFNVVFLALSYILYVTKENVKNANQALKEAKSQTELKTIAIIYKDAYHIVDLINSIAGTTLFWAIIAATATTLNLLASIGNFIQIDSSIQLSLQTTIVESLYYEVRTLVTLSTCNNLK